MEQRRLYAEGILQQHAANLPRRTLSVEELFVPSSRDKCEVVFRTNKAVNNYCHVLFNREHLLTSENIEDVHKQHFK